MGHVVPGEDPRVFGADCELCKDVLWSDGHTPKFVRMTLADITACPGKGDPPDGLFNLEQIDPDGRPCYWQYLDDDYIIEWGFFQGAWRLWARDLAASYWFLGDSVVNCIDEYNNTIAEGACGEPLVSGWGGTALVRWEP